MILLDEMGVWECISGGAVGMDGGVNEEEEQQMEV